MKRKRFIAFALLIILIALNAPLASAAPAVITKYPYPTAAQAGTTNVGLSVSLTVGTDEPIYFSTVGVQAALNYVMADGTPATPTDYTITVSGQCGEVLYLEQQQNKNILLSGDNFMMMGGDVPPYYAGRSNRPAGSINIDGMGRYVGPETLTIQGFSFNGDGLVIPVDATQNSFIRTFNTQAHFPLSDTLDNHFVYSHNITLKDCYFFSNNSTEGIPEGIAKSVVAVRIDSGRSGGCRLLSIQNCIATGIHSLGQLSGVGRTTGDRSTALEVIDCTMTNCANGVNVYGSSSGPSTEDFEYLFQNCDFNLVGDYAIRAGSGSGSVLFEYPSSVIIDSCQISGLTSAKAEDGAVVVRGGAPTTIMVSNSAISSAPGGNLFSNTVGANRDGFSLYATDNNTWNGLPYCDSASNKIYQMFNLAAGTSSLADPSFASEIYIVNKVTFDANGGAYSGGLLQQPGYATLQVDGEPRAISWADPLVQPSELPTRSGFTLTGWSANPSDPLSPVYPSDNLPSAALNAIDPGTMDPVLYAVWSASPPSPLPPPETGDTGYGVWLFAAIASGGLLSLALIMVIRRRNRGANES